MKKRFRKQVKKSSNVKIGGPLTKFFKITKVDSDKHLVSGYASSETKDHDGEIIKLDAIKKAWDDYASLNGGNIREMHSPIAAGKVVDHKFDDKGLYITAKIVDPGTWTKIVEKVLCGFSIGAEVLNMVGNTITELKLFEISAVDRPANPDALIDLIKTISLNKQKNIKENKMAEVKDYSKISEAITAANKMKPVEGEMDPKKHKDYAAALDKIQEAVEAYAKPADSQDASTTADNAGPAEETATKDEAAKPAPAADSEDDEDGKDGEASEDGEADSEDDSDDEEDDKEDCAKEEAMKRKKSKVKTSEIDELKKMVAALSKQVSESNKKSEEVIKTEINKVRMQKTIEKAPLEKGVSLVDKDGKMTAIDEYKDKLMDAEGDDVKTLIMKRHARANVIKYLDNI